MKAVMPNDPSYGKECTFAKDQPQYQPLPARYSDEYGGTVTTEWEPTEDEIAVLMRGGHVLFRFLTFGRPLQPIIQRIVAAPPRIPE